MDELIVPIATWRPLLIVERGKRNRKKKVRKRQVREEKSTSETWVCLKGDFRPISRRSSETWRDTTEVTINH